MAITIAFGIRIDHHSVEVDTYLFKHCSPPDGVFVKLNESGLMRCEAIVRSAVNLRVTVERLDGGPRLIDCGVNAPGGLEAGRALAEVCLAGLAHVNFTWGSPEIWPGLVVTITTDHPVAACMASQYAGWPIEGDQFFAMGSGPMRAARGREPVFDSIGHVEQTSKAVGVIESGRLPTFEVCRQIAEQCRVTLENLTLLVAPTSSLAGTVQVVSRTVETALHKMHELGFDIRQVQSGFGTAPLPPVAADDLVGLGRTNDAVLYGGQVMLWVKADDADLQDVGRKIPSTTSADYGKPFLDIFQNYNRDFYRIDPLLFSPAVVTLVNLATGNSFQYGETRTDVIRKSFSS